MLSFLKDLLFDQTKFVGYLRATLLGFGGAAMTGMLDGLAIPDWLGVVSMAAGGFIRSSSHKSVETKK